MAFGGPRSSCVRPGAHSARRQDSHNDLTPYCMAEPTRGASHSARRLRSLAFLCSSPEGVPLERKSRLGKKDPDGMRLPWKNSRWLRSSVAFWSGREDSNLRPPEPHSGALPDCATPRYTAMGNLENFKMYVWGWDAPPVFKHVSD